MNPFNALLGFFFRFLIFFIVFVVFFFSGYIVYVLKNKVFALSIFFNQENVSQITLLAYIHTW